MPVLDFMRFEEEYNAMLLAKYQHFMSFMPGSRFGLRRYQTQALKTEIIRQRLTVLRK